MDTLNKVALKQAIIKVLQDYLKFLGDDPESEIQLVIDETQDHSLIILMQLPSKPVESC